MQCNSTTFIYYLLGLVTVLTFQKTKYYLGTINPFSSFYNNLLGYYLN